MRCLGKDKLFITSVNQSRSASSSCRISVHRHQLVVENVDGKTKRAKWLFNGNKIWHEIPEVKAEASLGYETRQPLHTSKTITIMIAWYQIASGITTPVLEYTNHSLSYVNSILMNDFVRHLQQYNIKIKMKVHMTIEKQRFNDSCIMEDILNITTSNIEIKRLNTCRIYLQVIFLSEISNIKCTTVIAGSLTGDKLKITTFNLDWPNQNKPNTWTWSLWSPTIKILYCTQTQSTILRQSKRLGQ